MRKTMSLKQLAANRGNAQKSTGPKTPNGQAVSKMNALKHGILSKEVLVRGKHARESAPEFFALQARFRQHLKPVGPMEEMLVDKIVITHWRLRRALKAESGEIALNVDDGCWIRSNHIPSFVSITPLWKLKDPYYEMTKSAFGNGILECELYKVRTSVEKGGELTDAAIQGVLKEFGVIPNRLTKELEEFRSQLQQELGGLTESVLRAQQKDRTLRFIDGRLDYISRCKSDCEQREKMEEEAQQAAAVLPSIEVLDKITRYETKLERQLHRAMNQLERLQQRRLGEAVPPPLSIVV
jgi:hypothetical protein